MKKLLLFIFALCTVSGAWADDPVNLVSGKSAVIDNTATGNTYTDAQRLLITNGVKSNSEDANVNLKLSKEKANNTIDWFYIDMEASKTPKYVAITWTNCRPTSYDIYLSSEVPTTSNYGTKVFTQSSAPDGGAVTTTHTLSGDISGRYISFVPAQASLNGWGCFMSEFEVYEAYDQILSGISSQDGYKIWNMQYHVPATAVDQYGRIFEGETTWTLPSYATKVSGGFDYSADVITGVYTLTMSSNDNPSQTASKKYAILRNAPTTDDVPAIDQNNAIIIYSGQTNKQAGEVAGSWKNPNSKGWNKLSIGDNNGWFVNNFGTFGLKDAGLGSDASEIQALYLDIYSLDNHTGTIEIENSGLASNPAFNLVPGWNHIAITVNTTIATSLSPSQAVIIHLNEATNKAIDEDLVIYNVYFSKVAPDPDDDVKPVMVSAALDSYTHNSATLTLNATDNSGKVKFHIVDTSNSIDVTSGNADSGVNFSYTVTGLTAETSYNFTITAVDASDKVSDESKSVEVTTNSAPPGIDLTAGGHTIHVTPYHYSNNVYKLVITSDDEMTGMGGSFWNVNGVGTDMRTNSETHTFNVSQDKKTITITCTSTSAPNIYTPLYVMMPGEVNFGYVNLNWIDVVQAVIITPAGWASFSSNKDLNFDGVDNLTAYKATVNGENDVTLVEVTEVKAGEGVILKGTAGTYNVPLMANAPDALEGNLLKPGYHKVTEGEVGSIYAFGKYNGGVAFVKAAENYEVSEGRAYLDVSGTSAKNAEYLNFYIGQEEGETDGINKVNTLVETGVRYNLAGQRVGNDYKGIVIVNGRKVVIK